MIRYVGRLPLPNLKPSPLDSDSSLFAPRSSLLGYRFAPESSAKQTTPRDLVTKASIYAALGLLLTAQTVSAQSLTFGQLEGFVRDGARRPVATAEVRVEDRASGAVRFAITARDGSFRFVSIPAGRYDLRVEALGYRPIVHLDIDVGAGRSARLETVIRVAAPPVTTVDTVPRRGDLASANDWLFERGYGDLVGTRRIASDVTGLSTIADAQGVEGLPWRFTEAMVEGARVSYVGAPGGLGTDGAALSLPSRAFSSVRVGGLGFDVEVGGSGVGLLATSQRGGRAANTRVITEGGSANLGAALSASGPVQGDTAQMNAGFDYQRGTLAPLDAPAGDERTDERVSAFGRLDWQPGDRLAITARASGSRYTSEGPAERVGIASAFGDNFEALGIQAGINVHARLNARVSSEFRFSTDIGDATGTAGSSPRTAFAPTGLDAGSVVGGPFEDSRSTSRGTALLHFDLGAHRLKAGFTGALQQHDLRYLRDADGAFAFGEDPALGTDGVYRETEASAFAGQFRMVETAFLIQDAWRLADGFTVTLGTRFDGATLPVNRIERNSAWAAATGLDNTAVSGPKGRLSPRVGLRWELGSNREWIIEGGGGVYHDLPDRRDIAEALTLDRSADVRLGVGDISSWPLAPSTTIAPVVGRTLTMLGPDFEGPRTQRMALGITRRLGAWSTSLSGVYRHTDFLARRRDLNLPASPIGADQYGRPLYGTLQQIGAIVTPVVGSNRRFSEFDAAHVLESTGFSSFFGVTAGVERVMQEGLSVGVNYTYGGTRDNVPGFTSTRLNPFPDGLAGEDWAEGRSDLDIPHRLLVAADWAASSAVRLGVVYRLSSGAPFTPGVRGGVDANADGDWRNDPAFIDATLPGMDAVLDEYSCLQDDVGGFASRNSCRAAMVHRLDVRVALRIGQLNVGRLDLVLDALNVLAPATGPIDRALLLVDPAGSLTTNATTGVTSVPYVVNPNFGKVLTDRSPGILWRIGVRVTP